MDPFKDHRFIFVQLLFSLAVGEVARQTAYVYLKHGLHEPQAWASYCHLFLSLFLIASSWLGWRLSKRNQEIQIDSLFDSAFWVLLLDVLCVVAYFVLTRGVEGGDTATTLMPSATHEADCFLVVFALYAVWDGVTKAASHGDGWRASLKRLASREYWSRGWVSVLCFLMALINRWLLRELSSFWGVISADFVLFLLILAFRLMKENMFRWAIVVCTVWLAATCLAHSMG